MNENANDFWDTVEIARQDDVVIPKRVTHHRDLAITHRTLLVIHDNGNKNEMTNKDLIVLSHQIYKRCGSPRAESSGPSYNLLI